MSTSNSPEKWALGILMKQQAQVISYYYISTALTTENELATCTCNHLLPENIQ